MIDVINYIKENKFPIILVCLITLSTITDILQSCRRRKINSEITKIKLDLDNLKKVTDSIEFVDNVYDTVARQRLDYLENKIGNVDDKIKSLESKASRHEKTISNLQDSIAINGINIIELPEL